MSLIKLVLYTVFSSIAALSVFSGLYIVFGTPEPFAVYGYLVLLVFGLPSLIVLVTMYTYSNRETPIQVFKRIFYVILLLIFLGTLAFGMYIPFMYILFWLIGFPSLVVVLLVYTFSKRKFNTDQTTGKRKTNWVFLAVIILLGLLFVALIH